MRSRMPMTRSPLRRSEEHTSELQSLMRISYAVFCLKKKMKKKKIADQIHYSKIYTKIYKTAEKNDNKHTIDRHKTNHTLKRLKVKKITSNHTLITSGTTIQHIHCDKNIRIND